MPSPKGVVSSLFLRRCRTIKVFCTNGVQSGTKYCSADQERKCQSFGHNFPSLRIKVQVRHFLGGNLVLANFVLSCGVLLVFIAYTINNSEDIWPASRKKRPSDITNSRSRSAPIWY